MTKKAWQGTGWHLWWQEEEEAVHLHLYKPASKDGTRSSLNCKPQATSHIDPGPPSRLHPPSVLQALQIVTKCPNIRGLGGCSAFKPYHCISIICRVAEKGLYLSTQGEFCRYWAVDLGRALWSLGFCAVNTETEEALGERDDRTVIMTGNLEDRWF